MRKEALRKFIDLYPRHVIDLLEVVGNIPDRRIEELLLAIEVR